MSWEIEIGRCAVSVHLLSFFYDATVWWASCRLSRMWLQCTLGVRHSTLWPHNAGSTGAALTSGSASGGR